MFKIEPVQEKIQQIYLCDLFGVEYREDFFAYLMYDLESGEPMGFSQFEINCGEGYISDIREAKDRSDGEAMFILGRQTMNFIDICGAHICYAAKDAADARLLSSIGFKESSEGRLFVNMTGMFDGHCEGHSH